MPLEALHHAITPVGLHYLLIHFDIPTVDVANYELSVGGRVRNPLRLTLDEITSRPATTLTVTLECAGNGRARLSPRPMSQPWLGEAVGTAEWTGTSLASLLDEPGPPPAARDLVLTGLRPGVQGAGGPVCRRSISLGE